jgi:hypothetical protein
MNRSVVKKSSHVREGTVTCGFTSPTPELQGCHGQEEMEVEGCTDIRSGII